MRPQPFTPILIILALLFASLACQSPLETPTLDPRFLTPDPTFQMPADGSTLPPVTVIVPTEGPRIITGSAVKTDYASNGQGCDVPTTGTLVVNPDGTAQLQTTGLNITDNYNCKSSGEETWYIDGTWDDFSLTAVFTTCNSGGFTAKGAITLAGQKLLGTVSCFYKDSTQAIMLVLSQ
jgi:hypothetical protein